MRFDVALEDGAKILVRRYGRPDGVLCFFPTATVLPLTPTFPIGSTYCRNLICWCLISATMGRMFRLCRRIILQLTCDLERVVRAVKSRFGEKQTAGLFHSMSGRTAMKHAIEVGWCWDALVLFDPPNVPPPWHPLYATMEIFEKRLTEWALQRRRRFASIEEQGLKFDFEAFSLSANSF